MTDETKPKATGVVPLFLFGFTFFAVGCAVTFFAVIRPLVLCDRARAWAETPATIQSLEIETSHSSKGGTSYRLVMCYQYEFNGQTHTSERFTAFGGSDNVSSYHTENYARYKPSFDAKKPITCWVNPDRPDEAVVDRAPRFEMLMFMHIFTFTFPLVGLIVMSAGATLLHTQDPGSSALRIPLRTSPLYVFAIPTGLCLAYTLFIFSILIHFTPWPWYVYLLLLPAALLTVIFLYQCAYRMAFNGIHLDLMRSPSVGDTLAATLHLPCSLEGDCAVTLRCQYRMTIGSGKSRSTTTATLWKTEVTAPAISDGTSATFNVRIAIPPGQPASTRPDANPSHTWQLRIRIRRYGLRHTLTFEVPVRPAST